MYSDKGLIIIAVLSLVALVAAKCCGVKIDPIGKAKQYLNDLRDRWKWLDKNLNKFKLGILLCELLILKLISRGDREHLIF